MRLFGIFGFAIDNKGKTSGSRALFVKENEAHTVHKPHPSNVLKSYALKQVLAFLVEKGFINNDSDNKENEKEQEELI